MAFYCGTPSGSSNFLTILDDIHCRLHLLLLVHQCTGEISSIRILLKNASFASVSERLIEGTARDAVSHYFLRVYASGAKSFQEFFLSSEELLLEYRICCSETALHLCVAQLQHELRLALIHEDTQTHLLQVHEAVCRVGALPCVHRATRCGHCCIKVRWELVPHLVSRRLTTIGDGVCSVPCTLIPLLLRDLFRGVLGRGLRAMERHCQAQRLRIMMPHLYRQLASMVVWFTGHHRLFGPSSLPTLPALTAEAVPGAARHFPACMAQLHRHLATTRRLQHHQRYRYSLFLKDIGVPVDQSIIFWSGHYSTVGGHSYCSHSWQQHGRRYLYSIRHMYGLEGGRHVRPGHSCHHLQGMTPQPGDCGGCPFASLAKPATSSDTSDDVAQSQDLQRLLRDCGVPDSRHREIISLAVQSKPSLACKMALAATLDHREPTGKSRNVELKGDSAAQTSLEPLDNKIHSLNFNANNEQSYNGPTCEEQSKCCNSIYNDQKIKIVDKLHIENLIPTIDHLPLTDLTNSLTKSASPHLTCLPSSRHSSNSQDSVALGSLNCDDPCQFWGIKSLSDRTKSAARSCKSPGESQRPASLGSVRSEDQDQARGVASPPETPRDAVRRLLTRTKSVHHLPIKQLPSSRNPASFFSLQRKKRSKLHSEQGISCSKKLKRIDNDSWDRLKIDNSHQLKSYRILNDVGSFNKLSANSSDYDCNLNSLTKSSRYHLPIFASLSKEKSNFSAFVSVANPLLPRYTRSTNDSNNKVLHESNDGSDNNSSGPYDSLHSSIHKGNSDFNNEVALERYNDDVDNTSGPCASLPSLTRTTDCVHPASPVSQHGSTPVTRSTRRTSPPHELGVRNNDALHRTSRTSWTSVARDPSNSTLNFSSPAQYYSRLRHLHSD